jgi:hypothetical protein
MAQNLFRFTLSGPLGTKVIDEPEGWAKIKMTLERDKEYHSLVELIETPFLFYGSNGVHDGGRDYLKSTNDTYGVDAQVTITIDISVDGGATWEDLFLGLIDMQSLKDIDSRKIEVVITPDDLWSKFKSRSDTPVDIQSVTSLDDTVLTPIGAITNNLPSQEINKKYYGFIGDDGARFGAGINNNKYYQLDFNDADASNESTILIDEIEERYTIPDSENDDLPVSIFTVREAGTYEIECRITGNRENGILLSSLKSPDDLIDFYIKFGNDAEIVFSWTDLPDGRTEFTYSGSSFLPPNRQIRIYGRANDSTSDNLILSGGIASGVYQTGYFSYLSIIAQTILADTTSESFYLHDVASLILQRTTSQNCFYSEYLGSPDTVLRQYEDAGCGWPFILVRGLQVRQYTLNEKPFSISFNQWWDGVNPIQNLGLGYDVVEDETVIRVEDKAFFYNESPLVYFNWVNNIKEGYDKEMIFNKISVGYKKWQSEEISGIDDPQTKHKYATIFKFAGKELQIESDFIAASLAIENTRRTDRIKSADYKFDNDTFIISIDPVISGGVTPSTDDYFDSVTNLLNADTRYNISLTPGRNILRWLNFIAGCLQKDLTSSIKFTGGEGNYDMESNWNSFVYGNCFNITDENFSEKQDIDLATYEPLTGHLFQPIILEFKHPISFSDYKQIRENRTRAIAVSGTDSGHDVCFIKKLEYDLINSLGTFTVWKK